ncbi:MAG: hypothetical protein J0H84_17000 [Rhizobiales bacterium]|jgi:hypothetical protein|nr:hypothetical protein [Hyphomicrobiales bacterium]
MIKLAKNIAAVAALAACLAVPTVAYAQDATSPQKNGSMMDKGMMGGGMTGRDGMSGAMNQNGMMNMMTQMNRMMEMMIQMNVMTQMNGMMESCNKMLQASMHPKEDPNYPNGQMPKSAPAVPGKNS